ncbi:MAG: PHP domain-containing protein, partial [Alphaproteobacteria bacterium]|nr:PHP domain-containing protein [Alphaproteobacteria bacterium]
MRGVTFIHLRTHTAYSLSEGALQVKKLAGLARDAGMPAVAITDTGNLFGALEFSDAMADKGIQPIIGCTLRVDLTEAKEGVAKPQTGLRRMPSLAFLAKDEEGYGNLMKLSSRAYLDSPDNAEQHVTWDYLADHSAGLICMTGGPAGPVNEALVAGQGPLARDLIERLKSVFGDRLYIELQRHGMEAERIAEAGLIELAYDLEVPLVATNECYFAKPDDYAAHDALICIAEGEVLITEDRRRLTPEHCFKSQAEMAALFADLPEAVENTVEIAMRCAYRVRSRKPILPRFGEGDEAEELRRQAHEGLAQRIDSRGMVEGFSREDYVKRLDFELDVITKMQFPGYFLIVSDFIKYAKSKSIPVGPGRGSGAGSMVAYVLTITDLDPFRFNL